MGNPSQTIERTDCRGSAISGKVYVDSSGIEGFMSHECFNSEQVSAIFIEVCAKSMPEGMAGKPVHPSKPVFMGMDMSGKEKSVNRSIIPILFGEEVTCWLSAFKPVQSQQVKSCS